MTARRQSAERIKTLHAKIIGTVCRRCGAKAGERCSDAGVFVRDTAFHSERQKDGVK